MELGHKLTLTGRNMLDTLKMIKNMARVFIHGQIHKNILAITLEIKEKEWEYF